MRLLSPLSRKTRVQKPKLPERRMFCDEPSISLELDLSSLTLCSVFKEPTALFRGPRSPTLTTSLLARQSKTSEDPSFFRRFVEIYKDRRFGRIVEFSSIAVRLERASRSVTTCVVGSGILRPALIRVNLFSEESSN